MKDRADMPAPHPKTSGQPDCVPTNRLPQVWIMPDQAGFSAEPVGEISPIVADVWNSWYFYQ
jgi:hypothetical protein